jgi:hypothetical protein
MKLFIAVFTSLIAFNVMAASNINSKDQRALNKLAAIKLSSDFRMVFTYEKNVQVCGGEGPAYIGQVQVNKFGRNLNDEGEINVTNNWVNVDKKYVIFKSELKEKNAQLFDNDKCLE